MDQARYGYELDRALDALISAYGRAGGLADQLADPLARLRAADRIWRRLEDAAGDAAAARGEVAAAARKELRLSFAALGQELGISRQRAQQLVDVAEARRRGGDEH